MPEFFQQTLEPARVAAGLDPHPHPLALQAAVKSLGLTRGMHQLPSHSFLALQIQQRDLLEAGMEITAYNLHHGSFRTESLVLSRLKITRRASEPSLLSNHRSAPSAPEGPYETQTLVARVRGALALANCITTPSRRPTIRFVRHPLPDEIRTRVHAEPVSFPTH